MEIIWNSVAAEAVKFIVICLLVGPVSFIVGELLPREPFDFYAFPYRPFGFERRGKIYHSIKVHRWKDKAPDMSKLVKGIFKKKLPMRRDDQYLINLIRETCVAEFVHLMLILASPVFLFVFDGWHGCVTMAVYGVLNLPFIIIQRYNRPRLVALLERGMTRNTSK